MHHPYVRSSVCKQTPKTKLSGTKTLEFYITSRMRLYVMEIRKEDCKEDEEHHKHASVALHMPKVWSN